MINYHKKNSIFHFKKKDKQTRRNYFSFWYLKKIKRGMKFFTERELFVQVSLYVFGKYNFKKIDNNRKICKPKKSERERER